MSERPPYTRLSQQCDARQDRLRHVSSRRFTRLLLLVLQAKLSHLSTLHEPKRCGATSCQGRKALAREDENHIYSTASCDYGDVAVSDSHNEQGK